MSRLIRPSSSSVAPVAPGRAGWSLLPALGHRLPPPSRPAFAGPSQLCMYRPVGLTSRAGDSSGRAPGSRTATQEGQANDAEGFRRLRRRAHPRADRSVPHPPAEAPPRPRRVGGGLRDRAAGRGRRSGLPSPAHLRLRGVDDLPLPPDQRPDARGRSRDHPRGHGHRRRRRPDHAPQPVPVRPVLRRPRALHGPRPCLQRLRPRALRALLLPDRSDRSGPSHRHRRRRGRDRAGGGRRVPGHPAAGHRHPSPTTPATSTRCGPRPRPTECTSSSTPRPAG